MPIPRGVYYLPLWEILWSLLRLPFANLNSKKNIQQYKNELSELLGESNIVLMPHARICLYYILKQYNFPARSEILMTPMTLPDMANMVDLLGLKPRFMDFDDNSYSVNEEILERNISSSTKAVVITNLYGLINNLEEISNFCKRRGLKLIQDNTQSYNCSYNEKSTDKYSDWSYYSTCALKDIHTHMGAFAVAQNIFEKKNVEELCEKDFSTISKTYFFKFLKEDLIASIGLNRLIFSIFHYWVFLIVFKINPEIVDDLINAKGIKIGKWTILKGLFGGSGYKRRKTLPKMMCYHFTALQAEVGIRSIKRFRDFQKKRFENSLYILNHLSKEAIRNIPLIDPLSKNCFWRIPIISKNLEDFRKYLFQKGIDPGKTTLPCLPELAIFKEFSVNQDFKNAIALGKNSIFIPNYHYLSMSDLNYIIKTINEYFENESIL